jgi:hypothetical protein
MCTRECGASGAIAIQEAADQALGPSTNLLKSLFLSSFTVVSANIDRFVEDVAGANDPCE